MTDQPHRRRATLTAAALALALLLPGCGRPPQTRPTAAPPPKPSKPAAPKPTGTPIAPKSLSFTQDALHNCGTVAMLISWAHAHSKQAADLVRKQPDATYLVYFRATPPVRVTKEDLAAATKARLIRTTPQDPWPTIVLTAFARFKSAPGPIDFRSMDWIYSGEIATLLTGSQPTNIEIKPETPTPDGQIKLGPPIPLQSLHHHLTTLRGNPATAYTNRRIHIWAILDYDPARKRVLIRNPRRRAGEWVSLEGFRERFQLVVVGEE